MDFRARSTLKETQGHIYDHREPGRTLEAFLSTDMMVISVLLNWLCFTGWSSYSFLARMGRSSELSSLDLFVNCNNAEFARAFERRVKHGPLFSLARREVEGYMKSHQKPQDNFCTT